MNDITVFRFESQKIRVTIEADGEPRWVVKDICAVLGLDTHNVRKIVDEDEVYIIPLVDLSWFRKPPAYDRQMLVTTQGQIALFRVIRRIYNRELGVDDLQGSEQLLLPDPDRAKIQ